MTLTSNLYKILRIWLVFFNTNLYGLLFHEWCESVWLASQIDKNPNGK